MRSVVVERCRSLDAASALAVEGARRWFHLPYFRARMRCERDGDGVAYASAREDGRGAPAEFRARYGPVGPAFRAAEGTLDRWLTDRWCLHAARPDGTILRGEVDHPPWPLQRARAAIEVNTMAEAAGLALPPTAPVLHFSRALRVRVCAPEVGP